MSSGGGFSGGGGYSGGFGPPMGGFGGGFGPPMGGFGQQFGGFQPPQYGGGFGQPFGGGFQQPQYGGGFGFQQPQFGGFQNQGPGNAYARQNPYQPPTPPQSPNQPPPGMEVNPDYRPRGPGLQTMEVRPSDEMFRPIQRANPATGVMPSEPISDPNERGFSTQALIRSTKDGVSGYYTDGSMSRFVPDEPQAQQGFGFGNPYGGYGAPYGGSPYMGMFGGLGSLFGGNGFQGMNQQAQAQQAALQNQRLTWNKPSQFPQGSFSQNTVYPDGRVIY